MSETKGEYGVETWPWHGGAKRAAPNDVRSGRQGAVLVLQPLANVRCLCTGRRPTASVNRAELRRSGRENLQACAKRLKHILSRPHRKNHFIDLTRRVSTDQTTLNKQCSRLGSAY